MHLNGTGAPTTWLRPTAAALGLVIEEFAVRERTMPLAEDDVLRRHRGFGRGYAPGYPLLDELPVPRSAQILVT